MKPHETTVESSPLKIDASRGVYVGAEAGMQNHLQALQRLCSFVCPKLYTLMLPGHRLLPDLL